MARRPLTAAAQVGKLPELEDYLPAERVHVVD